MSRRMDIAEQLDSTIDDLMKSATGVDEDELDEDFNEDLYEDEDEDEDEDDDLGVTGRELSDTFEEEELTDTFDDLDDTYTTGKAKTLDAQYGGPAMPGKLMRPAEYAAWYKKITAKKGVMPENPSFVKSFGASIDNDTVEVLDVSPFLQNLTKSIGNHVDSLAGLVVDQASQQANFNQKLAKAVATQGRILQGLIGAPSTPKSYRILNKGGHNMPNNATIVRALEKSFQEGKIDQMSLTNFELTQQVTPEIQTVLAGQGLID